MRRMCPSRSVRQYSVMCRAPNRALNSSLVPSGVAKRQTTVDRNNRSGDVGTRAARETNRNSGNVIALSNRAARDLRLERRPVLEGEFDHACLVCPGSEHIDIDGGG